VKKQTNVQKISKFFGEKKRLVSAITFILLLSLVLFTFRDVIFCPYPAIVMQYKMRYNQMADIDYMEQLRWWAYDNFDPISGLNYSELLEWEHRHLMYWSGELQVRPELPIDILTTNLLGTIYIWDLNESHAAVYCSVTQQFTIYGLQSGATIDNSRVSWAYSGYALGRCGEFALLYNGLLLKSGYESRIVVDCSIPTDERKAGDHVFNQVWINNSWIHVDPTEGIINDPTMYADANRWNKCVNLVYAIEGDVITDVTKDFQMP